MVLKTCGTTKLLSCVPHMCQLAAGLAMAPAAAKYTRASFLFPEQQPAPHTSFDEECAALRAAFASLPSSSAYVLGDGLNGLQWHVFVAGAPLLPSRAQGLLCRRHPCACTTPCLQDAVPGCMALARPLPLLDARLTCRMPPVAPPCAGEEPSAAALHCRRPLHTLEVCMTGLSPAKAAQFFRSEAYVSARHTTLASGIQALVPGAGAARCSPPRPGLNHTCPRQTGARRPAWPQPTLLLHGTCRISTAGLYRSRDLSALHPYRRH
jgi:hypothetical protein